MPISAGEIQATLSLRDSMSASLRAAARNVKDFGDSLHKVGTQARETGSNLATGLTLPLVAAGAAAFKFSKDFETAMTKVETLTGNTAKQVADMRGQVLALAGQTGKGPQELAEGLLVVASTGLKGADAMEVLKASSRAAAVGLGETKDIARAVTSAMTAYKDTGLTAAQATDKLFAAVREGGAEASEFAGTLGRVVGIASQVGISFDEVLAQMATFTRLGVKADEAATALRGTIATILSPSKEASDQLLALGSSIDEVRKSIRERGLADTLIEMVKLTKGNDDAISAIVPNVRALAGVLGTAGAQAAQYVNVLGEIQTSTGDLSVGFDRASQTLGFKWNVFMAQAQETAIRMGDALSGAFTKALTVGERFLNDFLIPAVRWFANLPEPIRNVTVALLAVGAALGPALYMFGNLTTAFGGMVKLATLLFPGFMGVSASITSVGAASVITTGLVAALKVALLGVVGAVIVTGIVLLIKHFRDFNTEMKNVGTNAANGQKRVAEYLDKSLDKSRVTLDEFDKMMKERNPGPQIPGIMGPKNPFAVTWKLPGVKPKTDASGLGNVKALTDAQKEAAAEADEAWLKFYNRMVERNNALAADMRKVGDSFLAQLVAAGQIALGPEVGPHQAAGPLESSNPLAAFQGQLTSNIQGASALNLGAMSNQLLKLGPDMGDAAKRGAALAEATAQSFSFKFGAMLGPGLMSAITGGGNKLEGVGSAIGHSITGGLFGGKDFAENMAKKFGGALGGMFSAVLPGIGALAGPLISGIAKLFGFGKFNAGKELAKLGPEFDALKKSADLAGVSLDALYKSKDAKALEKNLKDVQTQVQKFEANVKAMPGAFKEMLDAGLASSGLLSKAFKDTLAQMEATGQFTSEIRSFRRGQGTQIGKGVETALGGGAGAVLASQKAIADLEAERAQLQKEYYAAIAAGETGAASKISTRLSDINGLLAEQREKAQGLSTMLLASQGAATAFGTALMASFGLLTQNGVSAYEAIVQLQPAIAAFNVQLGQTGFSGGAAFASLQALATVATSELGGPALQALVGINQVMVGLANTGLLDQQTFYGLQQQIGMTYQTLVDNGATGEQALALMQPTLQHLWELYKDTGLTLDENTQKLVDQAAEAGKVGDKFREPMDRIATALEKVGTLMADFLRSLQGVPGAAQAAADAMNKIGGPVISGVDGGEMHRGGLVRAHSGGGLASDEVPIIAQTGEGILSRDGMDALGALNSGRGSLGGDGSALLERRLARIERLLGDQPRALSLAVAEALALAPRRSR